MKIICQNPETVHNYFAWPSVARLNDNTLAMVCSGYRIGHLCPFGKTVISYSYDEGESWTRPAAVIDTMLDDRDGGIAVDKNGVTVVTSFNNSTDTQRDYVNSIDKPEHIKKYINAYLELVDTTDAEQKHLGATFVMSNDGYNFSDIRRIPVTAPHGPAPLADGGFIYVGRTFVRDPFDRLECYKLNADGSFEFLSAIDDISEDILSCEPHTLVLPDGKIIVHIRAQGRGKGGSKRMFTTYQTESSDGGKSWSTPHKILDGDMDGAPSHLLLHSSGAIVAVYGYRQRPYSIRAIISRDGGESWSAPMILTDDLNSPDIGYPASVELKDGSLLTVFYTRIGDDAEIGRESGAGSVIAQINWKL